jgi:SAM-dependent methyltransferase
MDGLALRRKFFPEGNVGGFSFADVGVALFLQINAVLRPTDRVLDFGAGRGEHILDDVIEYRRKLFNLRGRCAHVEGCDVDDAVLENPFLDHAEVIRLDEPLPYPDESFDIVFARFVLEHVENPEWTARELMRVLKPGGFFAALTPNKYGYIALAASAIPNGHHVRLLNYIQPKRKAEDVFPTMYRLNSRKDLERAFGSHADVFVVPVSGEPAYHFGRPTLYRIAKRAHKYLPDVMQPLLIVFARKR